MAGELRIAHLDTGPVPIEQWSHSALDAVVWEAPARVAIVGVQGFIGIDTPLNMEATLVMRWPGGWFPVHCIEVHWADQRQLKEALGKSGKSLFELMDNKLVAAPFQPLNTIMFPLRTGIVLAAGEKLSLNYVYGTPNVKGSIHFALHVFYEEVHQG